MQDSDPVSLTYGQLTDMVDRIKAGSVTFKPYPSTVNTSGTTAQFIASIQALNAGVGMAFLGTVTLSDLPGGLTQEEVEAYVYDDNLIYCICRSADTAPYSWWCASYQYAGWQPTDTTYSAFAGATAQQAGTAGLVPAPTTSDPDKFLKGDGTWGTPTNTTYSDFTGTDGEEAGTSGLVPAPATTDAGKFLKADGTWDTAGGSSSMIELTTADYNYPSNNPTEVALWTLAPGIYYRASNSVAVRPYVGGNLIANHNVFMITTGNTGLVILTMGATGADHSYSPMSGYGVNGNTGSLIEEIGRFMAASATIDGLTSTSATRPLSANQGKVLKDLIDSIAIRGAGAPTTSTVGEVGQLYEDGTNGTLYQLKSIDITVTPNTYNWEEVGAGGGGSGMIELTSADYNYPATGTKTTVALWLLEPGVYYAKNGVSVKASQTSSSEDTGGTSSGGVFIVGERRTNNYGTIIYYSSYAGKAFMFEINFSNGNSNAKKPMIAPTVVQTTGTSTTDVMSQNATSSMVFSDPATKKRVAIGAGAISSTDGAIAIGPGGYSAITGVITVDSADSNTYPGFNSTRYRIIRGLHDGQYAHDAATKGQLDTAILNGGTTAPTTATVGAVGTLYSYVDTTGTPTPHMMVCTEVTTSGNTTTYTWTDLLGGAISALNTINNGSSN